MASLGSRRNLCVNPSVKRLSGEGRVNDACLDLQQKRGTAAAAKAADAEPGAAAGNKRKKADKAEKGCPFLGQASVRSLADQALAKVRNKHVEQMKLAGV